MENASKALLIAGGVLLAMMILSLLVSVSVSISDMEESNDRNLQAQQIKEFNEKYLVYNRTRMYGTDVLTVFNKAKDEKEYDITIISINEEGNNIIIENSQEFKITVFKCENVKYNEETGRIREMVFRKIKTNN